MQTQHTASFSAIFWFFILAFVGPHSLCYGDCDLGSINIQQNTTDLFRSNGNEVWAIYSVEIENENCLDKECLPHNVVLSCDNLVHDPSRNLVTFPGTTLSGFPMQSDSCLLNGGDPLQPNVVAGFTYRVTGPAPNLPPPIPIKVKLAEFC